MANKKKIESQFEKYQGNMCSVMLEVLGEELGVSADALSKFDIGWAPVVNFKNGPNFQGWWAIPERGIDGRPIGLSLRSRGGMKVMYPGSTHGIAYELNPEHEQGTIAYKSGSHNWSRTMDAGVLCPVCGKPDGCLVSAEDVYEPKAAICRLQKKGSKCEKGFGYLHILKPEGHFKRGVSPLKPSDKPVIIVEGMTDAAVATELGFVGVGRPSNLAGLGLLSDLVRGREAIIIGENDKINPITGTRPGEEGMIAAFQVLRKVCPKIKMALPPEHISDLRQWKNSCDLTAPELLAWVDKNARELTDQTVIHDGKISSLSRAWLNSEHRMAGRYTLRYHNKQWFKYVGTKYAEVDEETEIRGPLYSWCEDKLIVKETPSGDSSLVPVICDKRLVTNILDALLDPCPLKQESIPAWINKVSGPDPKDLIPFGNGLLWVPSYLESDPESEYLMDHTPDFFTTFSLPFAFDATAECPHWMRYLDSTLSDEEGKIELLQEWFGYCLTSDISLHKMLIMRGPRRSGKSTANLILGELVGREQYGGVSLSQLGGQFGLEDLVGKQVAIMGDARLSKGSDSMRAYEALLNIVGGDPVRIQRKYLKSLGNHILKCRFSMATNELPELPDHAGALEARVNMLAFRNCFLGKEDFNLLDKLKTELAGITLWALEGLRRLRERGRFTVPSSSIELLKEWRSVTSPTSAFVEECCELGEGHTISKHELFAAWSSWTIERGLRSPAKGTFLERVRGTATFVTSRSFIKEGHKHNVLDGIDLQDWAKRRLL